MKYADIKIAMAVCSVINFQILSIRTGKIQHIKMLVQSVFYFVQRVFRGIKVETGLLVFGAYPSLQFLCKSLAFICRAYALKKFFPCFAPNLKYPAFRFEGNKLFII